MPFNDRYYDNEEGARSETALEHAMFRRNAKPVIHQQPSISSLDDPSIFVQNHTVEQQITTDYKASSFYALTPYPSFAVASPATIICCFQLMISARIGSPNCPAYRSARVITSAAKSSAYRLFPLSFVVPRYSSFCAEVMAFHFASLVRLRWTK